MRLMRLTNNGIVLPMVLMVLNVMTDHAAAQDHQMLIENCDWDSNIYLRSDSDIASLAVPFEGHTFGDDLVCTTKIMYTGSQSRDLKLQVDSFDLEGVSETGDPCLLDSERVTFTVSDNDGEQSMTWCGLLHTQQHVFEGATLAITYNSGRLGRGAGFQLSIIPVPIGSSVNSVVASEEPHLLYSPGYPHNYQSNTRIIVNFEGPSGSYLHIKARQLDIEEADNCKYDWLKIYSTYDDYSRDDELEGTFCGHDASLIDMVIESNQAYIMLESDQYLEGMGYVLEYVAYSVRTLDSRKIEIGSGEVSLFALDVNSTNLKLLAEANEKLHLSFLGQPGILSGKIKEDSPKSVSFSLDENLKHYWSSSDEVELSLTQGDGQTRYLLAESVDRQYTSGELLRAENSIAWIQSANLASSDIDNVDGTIRLYLPDGSDKNIKVTTFDDRKESEISIHNGPGDDCFDLTRTCTTGEFLFKRPNSVYGSHSSTLTLKLSDDLWEKGFFIGYVETGDSAPPEIVSDGKWNLIRDYSRTKNLFCYVQTAEVSSQDQCGLEIYETLDDSYDFDISVNQENSTGSFPLAHMQSLVGGERPTFFFERPVTVSLRFWLYDQLETNTGENVFITVSTLDDDEKRVYTRQDVETSSHYHNFSAPDFLLLGEQETKCMWDMRIPDYQTRFPDYLHRLVSMEVKVSPALFHYDTKSCQASLEVVGDYYDILDVFDLCQTGSVYGHSYLFRNQLTLNLYRWTWVDLPSGFLAVKHSGTDECLSSVTLDETTNFQFSIYTDDCTTVVVPMHYDSQFNVHAFQISPSVEVKITGFDPADSTRKPLLVVNVDSVGSHTFVHMSLLIEARYIEEPQDLSNMDVGIEVSLSQESCCDTKTVQATYQDQYIVTPNFPQPFEAGRLYEWVIQSSDPLRLEMVEMDVGIKYSSGCAGDYIMILEGWYDTYSDTLCGQTNTPYILSQTGNTYDGCCQVSLTLLTANDGYKGFMLRYRIDVDTDSGSGGSGDSDAGVAVGATIAGVLILILVVAAGGLIVVRYRRRRHQQLQNRRRRLREHIQREHRQEMENRNSNPNVFFVGPMIINTHAPPPPYPGPPAPGQDNSDGYYTHPDGGYINSNGEWVPRRGGGGGGAFYLNQGFDGDTEGMDEPPPYDPLMPRSSVTRSEHIYHPLGGLQAEASAAGTDSSNTNSGSNGGNNTGPASPRAEAPYSLAAPIDGQTAQANEYSLADGGATEQATQGEESGRTVRVSHNHRTEDPGYDSLNPHQTEDVAYAQPEDAGYASLSPHQAENMAYAQPEGLTSDNNPQDEPPPYEDSNPPEPPPAYEVATLPTSGAAQRRGGRLGYL